MNALDKNKEEIEEILKGCKIILEVSINSKYGIKCCSKNLCPICQRAKEAIIKTSILWCEGILNDLIFSKNLTCNFCRTHEIIFNKKREQFQAHLTWLKELENQNG